MDDRRSDKHQSSNQRSKASDHQTFSSKKIDGSAFLTAEKMGMRILSADRVIEAGCFVMQGRVLSYALVVPVTFCDECRA
jgi:hypothetical protein